MRNTLFIILTAIILLTGCRKDTETSTISEAYHSTTIKGIKDLTIKTIDSIDVPLVISSNDKEHYVSLEISGMPNYLYAAFSPAIGVPNFATYLSLKSYRGVSGNKYTLKLKTKTESGIEDTFDLHVNVVYDTVCVDHMVGIYDAHYECSKSSGFAGSTVTIEKVNDNTFFAKNLQIGQNTKFDLEVDVNCEQITLAIPDHWQPPGLHFYEGSGTFSANRIDMSYSIEQYETCSVTLTKH